MTGTTPQTDKSGEPNAEVKAKVLDRIIREEPVKTHQMPVEQAKQAASVENQKIAEDFVEHLVRDPDIPVYSGGGYRDVIQVSKNGLGELEALRAEYRGNLSANHPSITLPPVGYDTYSAIENVLETFEEQYPDVEFQVEYKEKVQYRVTGSEDHLREILSEIQEVTAGEISADGGE